MTAVQITEGWVATSVNGPSSLVHLRSDCRHLLTEVKKGKHPVHLEGKIIHELQLRPCPTCLRSFERSPEDQALLDVLGAVGLGDGAFAPEDSDVRAFKELLAEHGYRITKMKKTKQKGEPDGERSDGG